MGEKLKGVGRYTVGSGKSFRDLDVKEAHVRAMVSLGTYMCGYCAVWIEVGGTGKNSQTRFTETGVH